MRNETVLREGSIGRLLISMSLPVILVMLVNVVYNMVDVFFLGRNGDAMQVAAVSLASPLFGIASAVNTLLGFGACTASGIALGKGEHERIKQYSSFCLYSSLMMGVILMTAVWMVTPQIAAFLGANVETSSFTAEYLRILVIGFPFMIASGSLGNMLRADGESKGAVIGMLIGTGFNMALDPLFITGFGWGIRGAAWATVIGNLCSFIFILLAVQRKDIFSLSPRYYSWNKDVAMRVLSLGFPMASGTALMSLSGAFGNRLLVSYGNNAVAANAVAGKVGMLSSMLVMGICMGVQPAVSYAYGRRDLKRLSHVIRGTTAAAMTISILLGGTIFLIREQVVHVFLDDPFVLTLGKRMIVGSLVTSPIAAVYQMAQVYLQGTGKVDYATFTALLQKGIVYIPVLYGMNALFALNGLIFAGAVTDVIASIVGVWFCAKWSMELRKKETIHAEVKYAPIIADTP